MQLTGLDQGRDVVAWVDDLDVVVEGHVTRQDGAPAFLVEGQDGLVFRVHAYGEALEVQQDIRDVLLHAGDGRVFVQDVFDRDLGHRAARE